MQKAFWASDLGDRAMGNPADARVQRSHGPARFAARTECKSQYNSMMADQCGRDAHGDLQDRTVRLAGAEFASGLRVGRILLAVLPTPGLSPGLPSLAGFRLRALGCILDETSPQLSKIV